MVKLNQGKGQVVLNMQLILVKLKEYRGRKMKFNVIIVILAIFLMISCGKSQNDTNLLCKNSKLKNEKDCAEIELMNGKKYVAIPIEADKESMKFRLENGLKLIIDHNQIKRVTYPFHKKEN